MPEPRACSRCGAALAPTIEGPICPACLIEAALAESNLTVTETFVSDGTPTGQTARTPDRVGAYQILDAARRRRNGRRLSCRAGRADQAPGRAEAHQARHGHAPGGRALRRRASGPGADGSPEHRVGLRRGRHRRRPAVLRDGVRARRCRSPSSAIVTNCPRARGSSCFSRSATRCSTRIRKASSIAISSRRTSS